MAQRTVTPHITPMSSSFFPCSRKMISINNYVTTKYSDPRLQWYQQRVVSTPFYWAAKLLDKMVAWYIGQHIMDGYKFITRNYCKICLFGFSRGAYTARALAGMLNKVGLLPKDNDEQIPFAYKYYKRTDKAGLKLCAGFKETYCHDVKVEFVGVWDTVASVGAIIERTLPFTNSNSSIKTFRHALSLDETRAKFRPNYYNRPVPNEEADKFDPQHGSSIATKGGNDKPDDVLEVWFAGSHLNVGGGLTTNETLSCLSNIPLRWMVHHIVESGCGILFDVSALLHAQITLVKNEIEMEPTQEEIILDNKDAVQPIYDALKMYRFWWILEIIPLGYSWQGADGVWHKTFRPHLGKGRVIPEREPKFHTTVKHRINSNLGYFPKAEWEHGTEVYVY